MQISDQQKLIPAICSNCTENKVYMLTIFIAALSGGENETGLFTVLGTISDVNSYPTKLESDLQEVQND